MNAPDPSGGSAQDGAEPPLFQDPWRARAFAMTLALSGSGVFSWSRWTSVYAHELAGRQGGGPEGEEEARQEAWLAALERIACEEGLVSKASLDERRQAWRTAYERTPHGRPVVL